MGSKKSNLKHQVIDSGKKALEIYESFERATYQILKEAMASRDRDAIFELKRLSSVEMTNFVKIAVAVASHMQEAQRKAKELNISMGENVSANVEKLIDIFLDQKPAKDGEEKCTH